MPHTAASGQHAQQAAAGAPRAGVHAAASAWHPLADEATAASGQLEALWVEIGDDAADGKRALASALFECLEAALHAEHQRRAEIVRAIASETAEIDAQRLRLGEPPAPPHEEAATLNLKQQLLAAERERGGLHLRCEERARVADGLRARLAAVEAELGMSPLPLEEGFQPHAVDALRHALSIAEAVLEQRTLSRAKARHRVLLQLRQLGEAEPAAGSPESCGGLREADLAALAEREADLARLIVSREDELASLRAEAAVLQAEAELSPLELTSSRLALAEPPPGTAARLGPDVLARVRAEAARLHELWRASLGAVVARRQQQLAEAMLRARLPPPAPLADGATDESTLRLLDELLEAARRAEKQRAPVLRLISRLEDARADRAWLQEFESDASRFYSRGAHINLQRADAARRGENIDDEILMDCPLACVCFFIC